MTYGSAPQLLGRGDVAVGTWPLQTLRMDTALVQLPRLPAPLRHRRARWLEVSTSCRIYPTKTKVDAQELSRSVRRVLPGVALQAGSREAACLERDGNG